MTSILRGLSRSFIGLVDQNVTRLLPTAGQHLTASQQKRGFKDKGVLKLRCSKCYFKKLDDRWWVLCNEHPRHKQREKVEDHREKWVVTHITRGGKPFQKKPEAYICETSPPGAYGKLVALLWSIFCLATVLDLIELLPSSNQITKSESGIGKSFATANYSRSWARKTTVSRLSSPALCKSVYRCKFWSLTIGRPVNQIL